MQSRAWRTAALVTALLTVVCISPALAKEWSPQSFPNPLTDVNLCGRGGKPSWICDPDHILSEYSQNVVEGTVRDIAVAKSPYGPSDCSELSEGTAGYQVAVALVQSMKLQNGRSEAQQAEYFAKSLHNQWGVGDKRCNNGLVFFLSKDDRQLYLAADEQVLSKQRQQYVLERAKSKLRQGDFDSGIEGAIVDIGLGLSGADLPDDTDSSHHWDWGLSIFGLIFGGVLVNSCWSGYRRRREAKVCRSLLQKLKDEQATAVRNQQYPATSCPICFEDLAKPSDTASDAASDVSGSRLAGVYKHEDQTNRGASSSKSDAMPSAPPLGGRPEYESLLGRSNPRDTADQAGPTGNRSKDGGGKSLKPLSLPCGHTFCEDCISRWLNDKNSCPVCRKPLTGDQPHQDPHLTQGSAPEGVADGLQRQNMWDNDMYASEVMFRMGRLQRMYPYYVTRDMVSDWGTRTTHGETISWDAARSMQLNNPDVRHSHQNWGSHGATTDFGGGGGYGGGGTGGSW